MIVQIAIKSLRFFKFFSLTNVVEKLTIFHTEFEFDDTEKLTRDT